MQQGCHRPRCWVGNQRWARARGQGAPLTRHRSSGLGRNPWLRSQGTVGASGQMIGINMFGLAVTAGQFVFGFFQQLPPFVRGGAQLRVAVASDKTAAKGLLQRWCQPAKGRCPRGRVDLAVKLVGKESLAHGIEIDPPNRGRGG